MSRLGAKRVGPAAIGWVGWAIFASSAGSEIPLRTTSAGGESSVTVTRTDPLIWRTGVVTDLTIEGDGFFVLRDPWDSERPWKLTRRGDFRMSDNGGLVSPEGFPVMGQAPGNHSGDLSPVVVVDPSTTAHLVTWHVDPQGRILVGTSDGRETTIHRLVLWLPGAHETPKRISEDLYLPGDESSPVVSRVVRPGEGAAGQVNAGYVEAPKPWIRVVPISGREARESRVVPLWVGRPLYIAWEGDAALCVRDPVSDARYLTRCGALKLDRDGWVVTVERGYRVVGLQDDAEASEMDLRVEPPEAVDDEDGTSYWVVEGAIFDPSGTLRASRSDGTHASLGRLKFVVPGTGARRPAAGERFWPMPDGADSGERAGDSVSPVLARPRVESGALDPRCLDESIRLILSKEYRFIPHAIRWTNDGTSMAISGSGFFLLRDPSQARGEYRLTRRGRYGRSPEGYWVNREGWRLQGIDENGDGALTDVRTPLVPGEVVKISSEGRIVVESMDGWARVHQSLVLARVLDPTELEDAGSDMFRPRAGGDPLRAWRPGSRGMGQIIQGAEEILEGGGEAIPRPVPARANQVVVSGVVGRFGRVQRSADMVRWEDWLRIAGHPDYGGGITWVPGSGEPPVIFGQHAFDVSMEGGFGGFYRVVVDGVDAP